MLTLSLCKAACPELIPPGIGKCLGDGSDGQVFELVNDPTKVIKFSALFCYFDEDLESKYLNIVKTLYYLMSYDDPAYAKVYDIQDLGKQSREFFSDRVSLGEIQEYILYYYTMEKCMKLSDDEKKVFHSILCHEDKKIVKNFTPLQLKNILAGLSKGLDFDEKKVTLFCENVRRSPLRHLDIHVRNIMKTKEGDFKLIDFDKTRLE